MAKHFDSLTAEQSSSLKMQLALVRSIARSVGKVKGLRVRKLANPAVRTVNFDSLRPESSKKIAKAVKTQLKHAGMSVAIRGDKKRTLIIEVQAK